MAANRAGRWAGAIRPFSAPSGKVTGFIPVVSTPTVVHMNNSDGEAHVVTCLFGCVAPSGSLTYTIRVVGSGVTDDTICVFTQLAGSQLVEQRIFLFPGQTLTIATLAANQGVVGCLVEKVQLL